MTNLKVSSFDLDAMKMNSIIVIIGKRCSGKSTLIRDFARRHQRRFDHAVGMSNCESTREDFEKYIPTSNILPFTVDHVCALVAEQRLLTERRLLLRRTLLILEDGFFAQNKIFYDKIFQDIAYNGRNFNLTLVVSLPYCIDLPSFFRCQVDYCFVFEEINRFNKRRLYDNFFGCFQDLASFEKVFDQYATNFQSVVLDNSSGFSSDNNNIFYYKANMNVTQFTIPPLEKYIAHALSMLSWDC